MTHGFFLFNQENLPHFLQLVPGLLPNQHPQFEVQPLNLAGELNTWAENSFLR